MAQCCAKGPLAPRAPQRGQAPGPFAGANAEVLLPVEYRTVRVMRDPKLIHDAKQFHDRAEKIRVMADEMTNQRARQMMYRLAEDYDRLASRALEQLVTPAMSCALCSDTGWVCEDHGDRPVKADSARPDACDCPAAMPCPDCNIEEPPRPPRGMRVAIEA